MKVVINKNGKMIIGEMMVKFWEMMKIGIKKQLITKASKKLTNKMMVKIKEMMVKIGKMKDGNKFHM